MRCGLHFLFILNLYQIRQVFAYVVKEFVEVTWEVATVEFEGRPLQLMPMSLSAIALVLLSPMVSTLITLTSVFT